MIFERKKYLDELIAGRGNGLVKIITGVRRCGKSFLLCSHSQLSATRGNAHYGKYYL